MVANRNNAYKWWKNVNPNNFGWVDAIEAQPDNVPSILWRIIFGGDGSNVVDDYNASLAIRWAREVDGWDEKFPSLYCRQLDSEEI